jgi:hypothetical protein
MYDIVLWQKNMITRSIEQQRLAVAASKDVLLKQTDEDARRLRAEIAERTRRSASDPSDPRRPDGKHRGSGHPSGILSTLLVGLPLDYCRRWFTLNPDDSVPRRFCNNTCTWNGWLLQTMREHPERFCTLAEMKAWLKKIEAENEADCARSTAMCIRPARGKNWRCRITKPRRCGGN